MRGYRGWFRIDGTKSRGKIVGMGWLMRAPQSHWGGQEDQIKIWKPSPILNSQKKQGSLLMRGYRGCFRKDGTKSRGKIVGMGWLMRAPQSHWGRSGRSNHIHHQSSITNKIKSRYENQSSITPPPICRGSNSKDQKIKRSNHVWKPSPILNNTTTHLQSAKGINSKEKQPVNRHVTKTR